MPISSPNRYEPIKTKPNLDTGIVHP
jgi:hypothetical protein